MHIEFNQQSVAELFLKPAQYQVPPYQRGYSWVERQIDDFWGDISTVGKSGHFLGPMVLYRPRDGSKTVEVIDGQQRLTTMQILLALIRDRYIALGDPKFDSGDPMSSVPQSDIRKAGPNHDFALQSGDANRDILERFVLRRPEDPDRQDLASFPQQKKVVRERNRPLIEATKRLSGKLDALLEGHANPVSRLRQFEEGFTDRVTIGCLEVIDLNDAFLLFETLNARGLDLSAADLLKSHLLSRLHADAGSDPESLEQASDSWHELIEELGGGDITGFLRHYLLVSHDRVRKTDVFPFFKTSIEKVGAVSALEQLRSGAEDYAEFLKPDERTVVGRALDDLKGTGVDTHRITLLAARNRLDETAFIQVARLCELVSFRWSMTGGNAQTLETKYHHAAKKIDEDGASSMALVSAHLLEGLPTDAVFRAAFEAATLGTVYVAAYALRKIERALAPPDITVAGGGAVHVEHIMPRSSTDYWLHRLPADESYEANVQRWGNLTLLAAKLNIPISNGEWSVKTGPKGYLGSGIRLTRDLLSLGDWTSADIALRARWLAFLATEVWSVNSLTGVVELGKLPRTYAAVRADPTLVGLTAADQ